MKVLSILTLQWISLENNCDFDFHFNNTEITPTVLGGGGEIILANRPNDKHLICNINNNIPVKIPSHPYVLVNRSIFMQLQKRGRQSSFTRINCLMP